MHVLRASVQGHETLSLARSEYLCTARCSQKQARSNIAPFCLFLAHNCVNQDTVSRCRQVGRILLACSISTDLHMIFAFIEHRSIGVVYLHRHILTEHQIRGQETGSLRCRTNNTL